jgi:DNA-binding NtrC family response regulator
MARILLVDDEKDLGRTYELILENDLTILDIKMPNPNGFKLYDQLKSKDSKIKTLFITALSTVESFNTENKKVYPLRGQRHFIKKPLSMSALLGQVYSMLIPEEEDEDS